MIHLRLAILVAVGVCQACSQPPQKPPPQTEPEAASKPPAAGPASKSKEVGQPKLGTVGLIRELKDRGMNSENWTGVIGSIFTNDTEKDVMRVRYEVTIFYKDGTQGVLVVDQKPDVQTGQRVRVTGDRIESLEH